MTTATFPLFGGEVEFSLYGVEEETASLILDDVFAEALRLQRIFNLYDPASELSALNKERERKVSGELLEVIERSIYFSEATHGRYDVTKGKQILKRKAGEEQESAATYKDITIKGDKVTLEHPEALIDLGSIAKGYIVDKLMEFLRGMGVEGAFIDARGDLEAYGPLTETVMIEDPRGRGSIGAITLQNQAVATSGDYRQYVGTHERNHIVGSKDLASATVVAGTLMEADAAATCLMLLTWEEAEEFLRLYGYKAVIVDRDGKKSAHNGLKLIEVKEVTR